MGQFLFIGIDVYTRKHNSNSNNHGGSEDGGAACHPKSGSAMDAVRREIAGHLASALLLSSSSGTASTPGRGPTTATGEADGSDHPTMASLLRAIVYPHNKVHGDFAVPVAKLAKFDHFPAEQHPALVARKWAASIQPGTYVAKADAIGMYINIHVHPVAVTKMILTEIFEKRESFGTWKTLGHGKNVIVEFSRGPCQIEYGPRQEMYHNWHVHRLKLQSNLQNGIWLNLYWCIELFVFNGLLEEKLFQLTGRGEGAALSGKWQRTVFSKRATHKYFYT
ncbi:hypothetical protein Pelo_18555 [Pelomyxa schiedti]|nr:hypothetical protein Pelo_18555 [Pelomyxa schiedti]